MSVQRKERGSDSAFVAKVTHVMYERDTCDVTTPDGCWDIVVRKVGGRVEMLQTGLITRPVQIPYRAGDEYTAISFKPGVFMPRTPGANMVDRGVLRPTPTPRSFLIDSEELEVPTFENAEGLVERLVQRELLVRDEIVEGVLEGRPRAITPRSVQRHFLHATGLTAKRLEQIQRACRAVDLLSRGWRPIDVAVELSYADQAHLTRALRAIMGRTPGQIAGRR